MENIKETLTREGQTQLLRFEKDLTKAQKAHLEEQIRNIDFDMIHQACAGASRGGERDLLSPLPTMTIEKIREKKDQYRMVGESALLQGKVAAVLLAGGQGTRLGIKGPKGTLNVGVHQELYLFEILIRNMERNLEGLRTRMHLYIMTSQINHEDTVAFFKAHHYFGYPESYIHFFKQSMSPALDLNGKILLSEKDSLCLAPNGNGGWFRSLQRQGYVEDMKESGIEWLNVFSVDNVLQNIGDPVFIGAAIVENKKAAAKVIAKVSPEEKVGAVCYRNGRPSVVEYSELTDDMRYAKDPEGNYLYHFGVTLNYLFHLKETEECAKSSLPVHKALKKIECLGENGEKIVPQEPNAYKLEYFIFDILEYFPSILSFEVVREDEFAPIKNAEGVDSLESARKLYEDKMGIKL